MQVWFCVPARLAITTRRLVRLARQVERRGFDGMLVCGSDARDPLTAGSALQDSWSAMARRTLRLRLGVLLGHTDLRDPRRVAAAAAALDQRSGGRFELAVGVTRPVGNRDMLPPLVEGFIRLDEALAVLTGLWWTPPGERFTFTGRYHTVLDSPAVVTAQQPGPPLIVTGPGRRTTSYLAARWADEVNVPFRGLHQTAIRYWDADDAAAQNGRRYRGHPLRHSAAVTIHSDPDLCTMHPPGPQNTEPLTGTPQQIVAALHRYQAIGTARVYLRLPETASCRHFDLIAQTVLPALNHSRTPPPPTPPYNC